MQRLGVLSALAIVLMVFSAQPAFGYALEQNLTVTTPRMALAYGGRALIVPSVSTVGAYAISKVSIDILSANGNSTLVKNQVSARLSVGKYKSTTTVIYRTFSFYLKPVTARTRHPAGIAEVDCRVRSVSAPGGVGYVTISSTCFNPNYPTQAFVDKLYAPPNFYEVAMVYTTRHRFRADYVTSSTYVQTALFSSTQTLKITQPLTVSAAR